MESMCRNQLLVTGPVDHVTRFRADARTGSSPLSFDALRPAPSLPAASDLGELARALTMGDRVDSLKTAAAWRIAHWGSAAEPADPQISPGYGSLRYDFYGQPPIALVRFLATSRPSLRFRLAWCDPSARYAGQLVASASGEKLREARGVDGMISVLAETPIQAEVRDYFADLGE